MKLINLTPHTIIWQASSGETLEFPPSGVVARVDMLPGPEHLIEVGDAMVPVCAPPVVGATIHLPEPQPDTMYIVSLVVRQAKHDRTDLISPGTGPNDGAIRDERGQIVAVTRFVGNV